MKTKLFLILGFLLGPTIGWAGLGRPVAMVKCETGGTESKKCEKTFSMEKAKQKCEFYTLVREHRLQAEFNKFLDCVKLEAEKIANTCLTKYETVSGECVEGHVASAERFDEAERRIRRLLTDPTSDPSGVSKGALEQELLESTKDLQKVQEVLVDVTDRFSKLEDNKKKFVTNVEKLRPKTVDPTPNPDPTPNDGGSENPPVAEEKGKQTSPWQDLANAIMGSSPPQAPTAPVAQPTQVDQRLPHYQSIESGSSIAKKSGQEPKDSKSNLASSLSDSAQSESSTQDEKKVSQMGQLEGKPSGVSGKVESNGSSLKATGQKLTQGASAAASSTTVSEGYLSGAAGTGLSNTQGLTAAQLRARFGLGSSAGVGAAKKPLTVAQLRQKILAYQNMRTPAQLRSQAGIGKPHGNMFNSIRTRYERLSSTLRP